MSLGLWKLPKNQSKTWDLSLWPLVHLLRAFATIMWHLHTLDFSFQFICRYWHVFCELPAYISRWLFVALCFTFAYIFFLYAMLFIDYLPYTLLTRHFAIQYTISYYDTIWCDTMHYKYPDLATVRKVFQKIEERREQNNFIMKNKQLDFIG